MLTTIPDTIHQTKHRQLTHQKLILNDYPAIQKFAGILDKRSWYTDDIELLFIKRGAIEFRYGNEFFVVGANQIVLLKKNILVDYLRSSGSTDEQIEFFQFTIKYDLVKDFTKLAVLPGVCNETTLPVVIRQGGGDCLLYMESLYPVLMNDNKPADGLVKIKMLELLFYLSRIDKSIFGCLLDVREHHRANITSMVEDNINNAISVEQLAHLSGRSLSSFRRDFMAIYNMPPSQWIRLKRIEKAKELLLNTTMTVTDICYTLGFENIAHFSRLFKSHCGLSPSYYKTNTTAA